MSNNLPSDPALAAPYPPGLALDLALETGPLPSILEAYALTPDQLKLILRNPAFRRELEDHKESMKQEGWSFRKKAASQAELYLHTIYEMVGKDTTPSNVKADLIKSVVRWAGYDQPQSQAAQNPTASVQQMAEQLKSMPDGELELRVAQLVLRKAPQNPQPTPANPQVGVTYDAN